MKTIDARGLSCPQPVLLALDEMKSMSSGELLVQVDTEASKENVTRAAGNIGWKLSDITDDNGEYHMTFAKG